MLCDLCVRLCVVFFIGCSFVKPTNVEFPCSFARRHHNWTSLYYPDDQNLKKKQAGLENLSLDMRISNGPYGNVMGNCTLGSCSLL